MKTKAIKLFIIGIRSGLGLLFVYAGLQKFKSEAPKPKVNTEVQAAAQELPPNVVKIKAYIGGLKQTGYFWPMLGIAEILCGVLLLSQVFALLGAVMLIPLTLNIFLFEVFLGDGDPIELITHGLYFLGNIILLIYAWPRLKLAFLTTDKNFKTITS